MRILVLAKPGSKKEGVEKIWKDLLTGYDIYKVKINAKPVKWKANEAIIEVLADYFKTKKNKIKILKWNTAKYKLIEID